MSVPLVSSRLGGSGRQLSLLGETLFVGQRTERTKLLPALESRKHYFHRPVIQRHPFSLLVAAHQSSICSPHQKAPLPGMLFCAFWGAGSHRFEVPPAGRCSPLSAPGSVLQTLGARLGTGAPHRGQWTKAGVSFFLAKGKPQFFGFSSLTTNPKVIHVGLCGGRGQFGRVPSDIRRTHVWHLDRPHPSCNPDRANRDHPIHI